MEEVDFDGILALGQDDPEVLLRWVYDNLGFPQDMKLNRAWLAAMHRGAMNSKPDDVDPEFSYSLQLQRYPVDIEEFLFSPDFLNKDRESIYPEVLKELQAINNPGDLRIVNKYTEAVFIGGIGSAKTTTALYTNAYQLYVLSCFDSPHKTFGMDPDSEILFVFLGMAGEAAESDYDRFYSTISNSTYFRTAFPYDPRTKRELHFPHRIKVVNGINTIGQNVMGGLMDEVNFGAVIKQSKKTVEGGAYDQTRSVYAGLSRRRKSRFMDGGRMPGILCLVSSKRYPGEFTDVKVEEAKHDPTIYIYEKRVWDVKPESFRGPRFLVFTGSTRSKPEIVTDLSKYHEDDQDRVVEIPDVYRKDFQDDLIGSLRDIAGVSTFARYPYFQNVNAVATTFTRRQNILNLQETDFETSQLEFFTQKFTDANEQFPRWVHVDLGLTSDCVGIACGYVKKFESTAMEIGMMPQIHMDFVLRVKPPLNGEIKFNRVRHLITLLRDHGLPIKWVSFDAFQSVDSIQMLRQAGFTTGKQSMDVGNLPYALTKTAMYANRVWAPEHNLCATEFVSLEKDQKTGKIDHPSNGSKDCSDAFAGVVFGLTMRREIWARHGVRFSQMYQATKEVKVEDEQQ